MLQHARRYAGARASAADAGVTVAGGSVGTLAWSSVSTSPWPGILAAGCGRHVVWCECILVAQHCCRRLWPPVLAHLRAVARAQYHGPEDRPRRWFFSASVQCKMLDGCSLIMSGCTVHVCFSFIWNEIIRKSMTLMYITKSKS
jgi:hypothetical protein